MTHLEGVLIVGGTFYVCFIFWVFFAAGGE